MSLTKVSLSGMVASSNSEHPVMCDFQVNWLPSAPNISEDRLILKMILLPKILITLGVNFYFC